MPRNPQSQGVALRVIDIFGSEIKLTEKCVKHIEVDRGRTGLTQHVKSVIENPDALHRSTSPSEHNILVWETYPSDSAADGGLYVVVDYYEHDPAKGNARGAQVLTAYPNDPDYHSQVGSEIWNSRQPHPSTLARPKVPKNPRKPGK